jgi:hypothetical protein
MYINEIRTLAMLKSFLSLFEDKFSKESILNQLEVDIATGTGFWSRFDISDSRLSNRRV